MLLAVPLVVVFSVHISLVQRLRLIALFSLGLLLISISILRIKEGYDSYGQRDQTLWSSFELLLAVVVAVVPTIYGLLRNASLSQPETSWNTSARIDTVEATSLTGLNYESWSPRGWKDLGQQASIVMSPRSVKRPSGRLVVPASNV